MSMLFTLLVSGLILWVIGKLMEPGEQRKRDERVRQRTAEVLAQLEAGWKARDARMAAVVREASRPAGYDADAAEARQAVQEATPPIWE